MDIGLSLCRTCIGQTFLDFHYLNHTCGPWCILEHGHSGFAMFQGLFSSLHSTVIFNILTSGWFFSFQGWYFYKSLIYIFVYSLSVSDGQLQPYSLSWYRKWFISKFPCPANTILDWAESENVQKGVWQLLCFPEYTKQISKLWTKL